MLLLYVFRYKGMICSDHGHCDNSVCICNDLYQGDDCSCKKSVETCIAPGHSEICNGVGECVCGKCNCTEVNGIKYEGIYCDRCKDCTRNCEIYEECLISTVEGKESGSCIGTDSAVFLPKESKEIDTSKNPCFKRYYTDTQVCEIIFTFNNSYSVVTLDYKKECWKPLSATFVGIMLITVIIAVGLLGIIIYKIRLAQQDRREFAEFVKNKKREEVIGNPLYNSPVTQYTVPVEFKTFTVDK